MIVDHRKEIHFDDPGVAMVAGLIEGGLRTWSSELGWPVVISDDGEYEVHVAGQYVRVTVETVGRDVTAQEEFARYFDPPSHAETEAQGDSNED